jgi:mannosyltransferase OCH1-like enzyme
VVLLNRASFEDLFVNDHDIDIDALPVHHRSDFIPASLLKHCGGLYLDAGSIIKRSLTPILVVVKQYGFVVFRDQQGNIGNNLMASTEGGDVITAFYYDICTILRGDEQLEWCRLGSIPLEM